MVTKVIFDEDGIVTLCEIEAVHSNRTESINWRDLNDESRWLQGWK